jgi:hypothetical protein
MASLVHVRAPSLVRVDVEVMLATSRLQLLQTRS